MLAKPKAGQYVLCFEMPTAPFMSLQNPLTAYPVGKTSAQWQQLKTDCPSLSDWGIKTLRQGLDGYVGTVLMEPRYICKDHRNLFSNFYSKKTNPRSHECTRLHFFSDPDLTSRKFLLDGETSQPGYLGYSVIRPVPERCLGRTVIDPYLVGRNVSAGFYTMRTPFRLHCSGHLLTTHGYPYMSQDTDVTVCAHATLWGVCRYLSERHSTYAELLPYDLVRLTAPTVGRVTPYRGMTYQDYSKILSDFGCHPVIILAKNPTTATTIMPEALQEIYSYIESGLPVLASLHNAAVGGHVAALVGHTLDFNRPPASDVDGLVDSSCFMDRFIVMDDNFFPYRLMGFPGDPQNYWSMFDIDKIVTGVCPFPEKVYLPAPKARNLARKILKGYLSRGMRADFGTSDANDPLVTRLFVTTGASWKNRKLRMAVTNGTTTDTINTFIPEFFLPHFIWVMEVAPYSLHRQGLCTAEIVLDATANELEESPVIYARIGASLILGGRRQMLPGHPGIYKQFTHNLGEL